MANFIQSALQNTDRSPTLAIPVDWSLIRDAVLFVLSHATEGMRSRTLVIVLSSVIVAPKCPVLANRTELCANAFH